MDSAVHGDTRSLPGGAIVFDAPFGPMTPAGPCAVECGQAWQDVLNLEYVDPRRPHRPANGAVWIFVALSFHELAAMTRTVRPVIGSEALVIGYVFDGFFGDRLTRSPAFIGRRAKHVRTLRMFDRIFTPIAALTEEQAHRFDLPLAYMPIGVDCLRFGSTAGIDERFVTVNGYGRQPVEICTALSNAFNRGGHRFFHATNHVENGMVTDPARYRDHFWQLLRHSRIALAYAPEVCDPNGRFACSFVGQRWFESLAAGCVVAGKKPSAPEAAELLGWTDATIELPDDAREAVEVLTELADDVDRLETISTRNAMRCLQQHDWRWRALDLQREYAAHIAVDPAKLAVLRQKSALAPPP